ncbi:YkgJ family cysteine cluster protein [Deferribacter autotrophicus]|uniref:YkgJ family cysteine cluster protein n=1 Tax=Deferribacter autotrophicus TaxID=500465 RepID=A0A5A8F3A9_9BACT|nr:YkgJ family cysteine cluster protein [Deferribacter autotrophicus]KAA0258625.1 YkgJ family cysteine cluster protein [Deferribacter autotrophicus]
MSVKDKIDCLKCGVCCYFFDISTLKKPALSPCKHLGEDGKCKDYENRPAVCRDFQPDEICVLISTLSFEDKIKVMKKVYGIE